MSVRAERVRGHIRREIAEMLLKQEIRDPRLTGFVSITDVQLSRDLQYATVYFSVMGHGTLGVQDAQDAQDEGAENPLKNCQEALTHAAGFIRKQLGRRIRLRHTPALRFLPDESLNYGRRIENLLGSIPIPPEEEV